MSYFRASRKANVYQVQIGDKGQGLAPQATSFFIASGRGGWNRYRTRTFAPKRDFVFCMNRLGGVGAGRSQYKIRGLNHPDGARRCRPYRFRHRESSFDVLLRDVKAASGGDIDDENALLKKHPILDGIIEQTMRMFERELYFKQGDEEVVVVHLKPLHEWMGVQSQNVGEAGSIVAQIAGRLEEIGSDSGTVLLSELIAKMSLGGCPVSRAVSQRAQGGLEQIDMDGLPSVAPVPSFERLSSYLVKPEF